jgi:hypothetical protein
VRKKKCVACSAGVGVVLLFVTIIIIFASKGGGGDDPGPDPVPPGPGPTPPLGPTFNPYSAVGTASDDGSLIVGYLQANLSGYANMSQE